MLTRAERDRRLSEVASWTDTETAWLAGVLEGEGCFLLKDGRYPSIHLHMTDQDVVEQAAQMFGASSYESKRHNSTWKTVYKMQVVGKVAEAGMLKILPYTGLRRTDKICKLLRREK